MVVRDFICIQIQWAVSHEYFNNYGKSNKYKPKFTISKNKKVGFLMITFFQTPNLGLCKVHELWSEYAEKYCKTFLYN